MVLVRLTSELHVYYDLLDRSFGISSSYVSAGALQIEIVTYVFPTQLLRRLCVCVCVSLLHVYTHLSILCQFQPLHTCLAQSSKPDGTCKAPDIGIHCCLLVYTSCYCFDKCGRRTLQVLTAQVEFVYTSSYPVLLLQHCVTWLYLYKFSPNIVIVLAVAASQVLILDKPHTSVVDCIVSCTSVDP